MFKVLFVFSPNLFKSFDFAEAKLSANSLKNFIIWLVIGHNEAQRVRVWLVAENEL